MPILHVHHPVTHVVRPPRGGRPTLHATWVTSPLEYRHTPEGFLRPLPDALAAALVTPEMAAAYPARVLRLADDGLWCGLVVKAEEGEAPEYDNEDGWGFEDDNGDYVRRILGELMDGQPVHRLATTPEGIFMLKGAQKPWPREATWLAATPFHAGLPPAPEGCGPDASEVEAARLRLAAWCAENLLLHNDGLWIRAGAPGLSTDAMRIRHPSGIGLCPESMPVGDWDVPLLAHPWRLESYLATLRRTGERVPAPMAARMAEAAGIVRDAMPGAEESDAVPAAFVNRACLDAFEVSGRTSGKKASAQAGALKGELADAVDALAPWAARGAAWSIARPDWPDAMECLDRVSRLLVRSHPWSRDVQRLERALAYAADQVLPLVAHAAEDEAALSALGAGAGLEGSEAAAFSFSVADLANAPVRGADGMTLARVQTVTMTADGKASGIVVRVGGRRVTVPFDAIRIGPDCAGGIAVSADPSEFERLVSAPTAAR